MLAPFILCLMTANSIAAAGAVFAAWHISAPESARSDSTTKKTPGEGGVDDYSFIDREIRDAA